jgi:hypothetical protein
MTIIKHHPKLLQRWTATILGWYMKGGKEYANKRASFLSPEDIKAINPRLRKAFGNEDKDTTPPAS